MPRRSATPRTPPKLPPELPDHPYRFVPVPRRTDRRDGWTSDRQHAFIAALARLPSVAAAARSVGMSARSAYRLRDCPGAEAFAAAWDDALDIGLDNARDTAIERAIAGVPVPIVWRGVVVGQRLVTSDRLLHRVLSGKVEHAHLAPIHVAARYRRQVRDADRRLGGPVDWDAAPPADPPPADPAPVVVPPAIANRALRRPGGPRFTPL